MIGWLQLGHVKRWVTFVAFFVADLSYAAGPRVGAAVYNAVHLYAGGAVLLALGLWLSHPLLWPLGALWLAHCALDRALRYGLKSPGGCQVTHLGRIGRS